MFDVIATAARIPHSSAPRAALPGLFALLGLRRQRRVLAGLSAEQLADIGVSAQAAATEAARPVWDLPARMRA